MRFIFDLDDTLYEQIIPFLQACQKHLEIQNLPMNDIYYRTREVSDAVFLDTEAGTMQLEDMHVYRLQEAFSSYGIQLSREIAMQLQNTYKEKQYAIQLTRDLQQLLTYCVENEITLGIITNGPSLHQRRKVKSLTLHKWIPEEHILISSEVGVAKPAIEIFSQSEKTFATKDPDTYYIGDSYENDVIGSKTYGWKSIWVNKKNKKIPKYGIHPDWTVTNTAELVKLLKLL